MATWTMEDTSKITLQFEGPSDALCSKEANTFAHVNAQSTTVNHGTRRAFRLPDPRKVSQFSSDRPERHHNGVDSEIWPYPPCSALDERQEWIRYGYREPLFSPSDYSQPPSPWAAASVPHPGSMTFLGPANVRREHDQCISRETPLNGFDVRHRQHFDVPSLPPRFSPGAGTQAMALHSIDPTEYEEDASLAWSEVEVDEARERITQDVANNINGSKYAEATRRTSSGESTTGNSGELRDAYTRMLKGARDGSNNVTEISPPTSRWMMEASSGTAPRMIPLRRKPCEVPGCRVQPSYGPRGTTRPRFCTGHKTKGMVGLKNRPCRFPGCTTRPHYGQPAGRALFCASHKKTGMVHLFKGAATRRAIDGRRKDDKDGFDELPDANQKDAPGERPGTEDGYQDRTTKETGKQRGEMR